MLRLRRALIFLLGVSIPFSNLAISFAGRNWSFGLIASVIYFLSLVTELSKLVTVPKIYGKYVLNILVFAILLTIANITHINYVNTPIFPTTLILCSLLFVVLLLHDSLDRGVILTCFYGITAGTILMAVFYMLEIGNIGSADGDQVTMFGENPNVLGVQLAIGSIVLLNDWILRDKLNLRFFRFLLLAAYIPIVYLLFATGSRIAFLVFATSILTILLLFKSKNIFRKLILLATISIAAIYVFQWLINSDLIIVSRLLSTVEEGDISGRDNMVASLWPYVVENIMFGVGETGYVEISREALNRVTEMRGAIYGYSPHNVFVELLLYTGIIGLLFYLVFWIKILISSFDSYRFISELLPILFLIPVIGCILSAQILTSKWAYIVYAYVIATGVYARKRNKEL